MLKLILLFCVAIQLVLSTLISDSLVIELPDGQVQGATYISKNNKTYFGFRGIPYAAPPTGNLRFEAPQPPKPWDEIWDASQDSKACLTIYHSPDDNESEDCLYINVYTPEIQPASKLPVMFYVYGGGFTSGTSSKSLYGPDFLIEQDVIVVSFNYRLNTFGFASTGDSAIRGNAGLKDQSFALKWTNDNIAYFGGDPEKITIFGQSAGGTSTGLHLLSKKSAGLFRAAIVQSGSALTTWAVEPNPKPYVLSLVEALSGGNYENDTQKLKEFLQEKSAEELITATMSLTGFPPTSPVLEPDDDDAFISESPYELIESGRFHQVPILTGICAEESLMFLVDLEQTKQTGLSYDSTPSSLIPSDLRQNSSDEDAVIKAVQNIYLKEGETFSSNLVAVADFGTDNTFARGVIKQAQVSATYVPVFLYQFAYFGRPLTAPFIDGAEKAGHSAELPFLFYSSGMSDTTDPEDLATQNRITYLWANFAKFLNPTPEPSELLDNIIWPTISPTDLTYLNINDTVEIRSNLKSNSFPEWDKIYETYGKKPFITY